MTADFFADAIKVLVPMILSLTLHEYAHAITASRLGDQTAREQGRLTLNPLPHIDPVGTILLPLLLMVMAGGSSNAPFFGWARPVPYNPTRFSRKFNMRTGAMLVAAAGPISNLAFALLLTLILGLSQRFGLMGEFSEAGGRLLVTTIGINVGLAVFNFVPLPPLDGAKVLTGLLPIRQAQADESLMARAGFIPLMILIWVGGRFLALPMAMAYRFLLGVVLPLAAGS